MSKNLLTCKSPTSAVVAVVVVQEIQTRGTCLIFQFHATTTFQETINNRAILYILLHHIYSTAIDASYFGD